MTCWQCGVPHPGERDVTLHDGRVVGEYSDEWRRECEARFVLDMPSRLARYKFIEGVQEARGEEAVARLCADIAALLPEEHRFFAVNGMCARLNKIAGARLRTLANVKPPPVAGQADLFSN